MKYNIFNNTFTLFGFKSKVYPDTGVFPDNYFLHLLKDKEYATCLDLGAYIGDTAFLMNKYLYPQKIYAFEPDPDNMKILNNKNLKNNFNQKI